MEKDLVLESPGKWGDKVETILPNIPNQRYTLGPSYPGVREGEEFLFSRNEDDLLDPTHGATISVDGQGQYWIQNGTRTVERTTRSSVTYNTFVNKERVKAMEMRCLKSGDIVSIGDPEIWRRNGRPNIFRVKERIIIGGSASDLKIGINNEDGIFVMAPADSPLGNNLILSEIMSYLTLNDLKNARQVCKKWEEEASKHLEKRGKVYFSFINYENPGVFRYLHEMRGLKMRNLHIFIKPCQSQYGDEWCNYEESPRFSPLPKMLDDLRKLLNSSHNFSTLFLEASIGRESDVVPFSTIFQKLGGKLVELTLNGCFNFFPRVFPSFPMLTNLKKFTHHDHGPFLSGDNTIQCQWVSHIVSLFSNNLEQFTSSKDLADLYIKTFLEKDMPKLRGVSIDCPRKETLTLLREFKNPLKSLKLLYSNPRSEEEDRALEEVLVKHSQALETLVIRISDAYFPTSRSQEVKFPSLPKLLTLHLEYDQRTRVSWAKDLNYNEQFPSLRKLTVKPELQWTKNDQVFNAFFPDKDKGELRLRSETVQEVWVPLLRNPERPSYWAYLPEVASFQHRMDTIREMFPNAGKINFLQ